MRPGWEMLLVALLTSSVGGGESRRFRGKTLEEWSARVAHPEAVVRRRAVSALGLGRFGKAAVPSLLRALHDDTREVRDAAMGSLRQLGPAAGEAVPSLLTHARTQPRDLVPWLNLAFLGPDAIRVLLREPAMKVDAEGPESPRILFPALSRLLDPSSLGPILDGLRDPDARVRLRALWLLEGLRTDHGPAIPALVEVAGDRNGESSVQAVANLARLGRSAERAVPTLARLAEQQDYPTHLVGALLRAGPAGEKVVRLAFQAGDVERRVRILSSLAGTGTTALDLIESGLDSPSAELREASWGALRKPGVDPLPLLPRLIRAYRNADIDDPFRAVYVDAIALCDPPTPESLEILGRALRAPCEVTARTAHQRLIALGPAALPTLPLVLDALRDPRPTARAMALELVSLLGSRSGEVHRAVRLALRDPEPDIRAGAARALGQLGPAPPREASGDAGRMGHDAVGEALRRCLRDPVPGVRIDAARAMIALGVAGEEVVRVLTLEFLGAVFGFGGRSNPVPPLEDLAGMGPAARSAVPWLLLALGRTTPGSRVHLAIISVLGEIGPAARDAVPMLERLLLRGEGETASVAARALLRMGERAVPVLRRALAERGDGNGARTILEQGLPPSLVVQLLPELMAHLESEDETLRVTVAGLVAGATGNERAICRLSQALASPDDPVVSRALESLGRLGKAAASAIPAVTETLLDLDKGRRTEALKVLERIGPDAEVGVPAILASLSDPCEAVRRTALDVLGRLPGRDSRVHTALRQACRDRSDTVRVGAALALKQRGANRARVIGILGPVLRRGQGDAQAEAAEALWNLGEREAVLPCLVRNLQSGEEGGQQQAVVVLRKIKGQAPGVAQVVRPLRNHPSLQVRRRAAVVLGP